MALNEDIDDVVARYSPSLLSYISSQVSRREDAEDILQDVLFELARANASDDGSPIERVSAWLYRVARNAVFSFRRRKRELTLSSMFDGDDEICEDMALAVADAADEGPEGVFLRKLIGEELDHALAELPAEQREAFCLTVFDGLPVKAIAEMTATPVATVISRKHYAVKYLRKKLHELYYALTIKD